MPPWSSPFTKKGFFDNIMQSKMPLGTKLAVAGIAAAGFLLYENANTSRPAPKTLPGLTAKDAIQLQKESLLNLISAKTTGPEKPSPPLTYDASGLTRTKAVFLISEDIKPEYKISERAHRYFLHLLGVSLKGCSHWAIMAVDRGCGDCIRYDLMSDPNPLTGRMGKNELRTDVVTQAMARNWLTCSYIGETTKSDAEIRLAGSACMTQNPRYDVLMSSCQTWLENVVRLICDGKIVSTPTAWRELKEASPPLAAYWYCSWKTSDTIIRMTNWFGRNAKALVEEDVRTLKKAFEDF